MRWISAVSGLVRASLLFPIMLAVSASAQAQDAKPFTNEQLDQMTAQIALYPDSLLRSSSWRRRTPTNSRRRRVVEGASGCQGRRRGQDGRERGLGSLGRLDGRVPEVVITLARRPSG